MTDTRTPTPRSGGRFAVPTSRAGRAAGEPRAAEPLAESRVAPSIGSLTQPRFAHPLAWWIWAGAVALALTRVSNPLVLALTISALITTALVCREPRGAGNLFSTTLNLALVLGATIVVIRTVFYVLLGLPDSSPVILHLPGLRLPWLTNLTLLGPIHVQGLVGAVTEGVRLAGLVITFGAASALSNPRRALRLLPSSLHHVGTAAVIAVAGAPQLVESAARVRRAQRLRAPAQEHKSFLRSFPKTLVPVLSGALDRALILAGSMDSRGYARARSGPRWVGLALIIALLSAAAGTYGLLDATTPPAAGFSLLAGGFAIAIGASIVSGRAVLRTRYFSPSWSWRETIITLGAAVIAAASIAGTWAGSRGLGPWRVGEAWPGLPLFGALIVIGTLLPIITRSRTRQT